MRRIEKSHIATIVHRRLADIMKRQSNDPRFKNVTISNVETSSDLSFARIFVSVFPRVDKEAIVDTLNHAAGFFRRQLGHTMKTRNTPKLHFVYDSGFDHSDEIENLILQQKNSFYK